MTIQTNRRQFLAGTGVALGSTVLSNSSQVFAGGHLAEQQLRTVGLSVTVQERILNDFKEQGWSIFYGLGKNLK